MAASKDVICNICEAHSVNTSALKWCSECDEAFCSGCLKFHATAKATRDHDVIDVGDFKQLPESVLEITQYCEEHRAAFQNFCVDHDCPCCRKCINTKHRNSKELPALDDVIGNAKSSVALQKLEENLLIRSTFLNDLAAEKNKNVEDVKKKENVILRDIKLRRARINAQLDAIEQETEQVLGRTKNNTVKNLEEQKRNIEEKKRIAFDLIESVEKLKKHGSNLQVFLGIRKFEQSATEKRLFTEDEQQSKFLLKNANIAYKETPHEIGIKSFGDISVEFTESSVHLSRYENKGAQIVETPVSFDQLQIKPTKKLSKYSRLSDLCFGCAILPTGKFLIADRFSSKLITVNQDGVIEDEMTLNTAPYDVTILKGQTNVAVTAKDRKEILIIDFERKYITKTISMVSLCYGLAIASGNIITCTSKGITLLGSGQTEPVQNLIIGTTLSDSYIDFDGKHMFYSTENSVTCSDIGGHIRWTFKNPILKAPRGIKVNKMGIAFVACTLSNTIVAISSCGKKHKSFSIDLVKRPRTLCFDEQDDNKLLICGWEGDIALYRVSF